MTHARALWAVCGAIECLRSLTLAAALRMRLRAGSGNLEAMMEHLEGALRTRLCPCTRAHMMVCVCFDATCSAATTPGEPLPPGGREPPEAQKLALLRELMTFITWCAQPERRQKSVIHHPHAFALAARFSC